MGLALAPASDGVLPSIIQQLATEGIISAPVLTLRLPPVTDTFSQTGFAFFGNASSLLANTISVTQQNVTSSGFWDLQVIPNVNEEPIFPSNATRTARINTLGNVIALPSSDMQTLIASIPEAQSAGGGFALPCDATTSISLDINGNQFVLPPENFISDVETSQGSNYCFARFGTQTDTVWSLGSPFTSKLLITSWPFF
jgi:hypothetical protein